ncbi:MAG: GYF domain-containing protein [Gemmataceae bacterium]
MGNELSLDGASLPATRLLPGANWLVSCDGKSKDGPYTWEKIAELLATGTLAPEHMALADGDSEWIPIKTLQQRFRTEGLC